MPACVYCGQETDVHLAGKPCCEQCAIDRELARRKFEQELDPDLGKADKTVSRNGAPEWFVDDRDLRED